MPFLDTQSASNTKDGIVAMDHTDVTEIKQEIKSETPSTKQNNNDALFVFLDSSNASARRPRPSHPAAIFASSSRKPTAAYLVTPDKEDAMLSVSIRGSTIMPLRPVREDEEDDQTLLQQVEEYGTDQSGDGIYFIEIRSG